MRAMLNQLFAFIVIANLTIYTESKAQVFATTENHGVVAGLGGLLCIGCNVNNPGNAVDGNLGTYTEFNIFAGLLGAYVYQNLYFPADGVAGDYLSFVIDDPSGGLLDINLLGGLSVRTYSDGVYNNDSYGIANITLGLLSGSTNRYVVSIQMPYAFDQIQIRLNAGLAGTVSRLRVYYATITSTPLPIRFVAFKAVPNTLGVQLNWELADHDAGMVSIEKSYDGNTYEEIATVNIETNKTNYEFTDFNKSLVSAYYRLKYEKPSSTIYSDFTIVNPSVTGIAVYPNPCSDNFKIIKGNNQQEEVNICITTMEGKPVYTNSLLMGESLNLTDVYLLEDGLYNVSISSPGETYTTVLIKKK